MTGKKLALIMLMLALFATSASAVNITASVDKQDVGVGDAINLKVTVTGQGGTIADPTMPDLSAFELYSSGRSQRISVDMRGAVSTLDISYILIPKKSGELLIGPITARDNTGMASTEPIKIHVGTQGTSATPGNKPPQTGQAAQQQAQQQH